MIFQALLGTLLTWGLTALGSAMVYVVPNHDKVLEQKILDASLGFAAGVSEFSLSTSSVTFATYARNIK
jgi:zinc transporter ZupT